MDEPIILRAMWFGMMMMTDDGAAELSKDFWPVSAYQPTEGYDGAGTSPALVTKLGDVVQVRWRRGRIGRARRLP